MNRFESSFQSSESGVFCMEPESRKSGRKNTASGRASGQHGRWMQQLRDMPDVRLERIMKIRDEIKKGTYETEGKWRVALDRLLADLS